MTAPPGQGTQQSDDRILQGNLYTSGQLRKIDQMAIDQYGFTGLQLMNAAGAAAFSQIMQHCQQVEPLVVLCGSGNNGGDGYVVADLARSKGLDVVVVSAASPTSKAATQACQNFMDNGGRVSNRHSTHFEAIRGAGLVVDALFGIGLNRPPMGAYAALIRTANQCNAPVVSLDIASGLNSDTGLAYDPCINAAITITFIGRKLGLYCAAGKNYRGQVILENLNLPEALLQRVTPIARLVQPPAHLPAKLVRKRDSHKGDYGKLVVAGGEAGMLGASLLCGRAALRCGSGLVTVLSTMQHLDVPALYCAELMSQCMENMDSTTRICKDSDVLILGPGLGQSPWSKKVFDTLMAFAKPMVVDADGLNLLSAARTGTGGDARRDDWVLTPHPGEAARLLGTTITHIQNHRLDAANAICEKYGGVCVLKGMGTVIAERAGAVKICDGGNPGMATAGMGDVLSGIVGSLMGQGLAPFEAAEAGVWLHAQCADKTAQQMGMASLLAGDVIDALPAVLTSINC